MKTKLQTVMCGALLAAGVMLSPSLRAQAEGSEPAKPRQERREGGPRGAMNVERLKEALGLTDEQVAKLKPIFEAQNAEIQAIRKEAGENADRAALREKMKAVRDKYKPQIEEVLTAEQKAKLAAMSERRPPGGPGQGAGGPPPADAPHKDKAE